MSRINESNALPWVPHEILHRCHTEDAIRNRHVSILYYVTFSVPLGTSSSLYAVMCFVLPELLFDVFGRKLRQRREIPRLIHATEQ